MKKLSLGLKSVISAILATIYILGVVLFMSNGERMFDQLDNEMLAGTTMLLLFVFSALITGSLILGRPISLFLEGKKQEGWKSLFYTGLSLFVILVIVILIVVLL